MEPDYLSYFELVDILVELGYPIYSEMFYLNPNCEFDKGLVPINEDKQVMEMVKIYENLPTLIIYVKSGIGPRYNPSRVEKNQLVVLYHDVGYYNAYEERDNDSDDGPILGTESWMIERLESPRDDIFPTTFMILTVEEESIFPKEPLMLKGHKDDDIKDDFSELCDLSSDD